MVSLCNAIGIAGNLMTDETPEPASGRELNKGLIVPPYRDVFFNFLNNNIMAIESSIRNSLGKLFRK
jgi:hypothetical protein